MPRPLAFILFLTLLPGCAALQKLTGGLTGGTASTQPATAGGTVKNLDLAEKAYALTLEGIDTAYHAGLITADEVAATKPERDALSKALDAAERDRVTNPGAAQTAVDEFTAALDGLKPLFRKITAAKVATPATAAPALAPAVGPTIDNP